MGDDSYINPTDWSEAGSAVVGSVTDQGDGSNQPLNTMQGQNTAKPAGGIGGFINEVVQGFESVFSPDQRRGPHTVITPPVGDPYLQNPDALKSRRQVGTTPFQELIVNCHEFRNTQSVFGQNAITMTQAATATALQVALSIGGTNYLGDTTNLSNIINNIVSSGIQIGYAVIGAGIPVGTNVSEISIQNVSPYAINSSMNLYLANFFGAGMNDLISGDTSPSGQNSSFPAWATVQVPVNGNFLKLDLLPAQATFPTSYYGNPDNPNQNIQDNTGVLGTGDVTNPIQDYSQQSNRNIFIQFDSPNANILIAKPGRTFNTEGFENIYLTFQADNGRIRVTSGYGNATIGDNDTSKLSRQNLHLWPGEEIFNDPYLHPVPFSISLGAALAGETLNTMVVASDYIIIPTAVPNVGKWYTWPIIMNKSLFGDTGTGINGTPWINLIQNTFHGTAVGWITRITVSNSNFDTGGSFLRFAICVGDTYASDGNFMKRTLWQKSITMIGTGNNSFMSEKNYDMVFPTPIRFTLMGRNTPNKIIKYGIPTSYGDDLFLMVQAQSAGASENVNVAVEGYMMGGLQQKNNIEYFTLFGDFSAASATISNVTPNIANAQWMNTTPLPSLIGPGGTMGPITATGAGTLTGTFVAGVNAIQAPFNVVNLVQNVMIPQTVNVHPYPLDRNKNWNNSGLFSTP